MDEKKAREIVKNYPDVPERDDISEYESASGYLERLGEENALRENLRIALEGLSLIAEGVEKFEYGKDDKEYQLKLLASGALSRIKGEKSK